MRVGPFRLTEAYTDRHVAWLKELVDGARGVGLPLLPLSVEYQDGLEVRVTDSVLGGGYARFQYPRVFLRPFTFDRGVLWHEVGHAYDRALGLTWADKVAVHRAMHDGDPAADDHFVQRNADIPDVSPQLRVPHGWISMRNPHNCRAGEAFAWWFAWRCGHPRSDWYGPHRFADAVTDVVRVKAKGVRMFSDVDPDSTHADAIHELAVAGVIGGFPDGTFRPGEPVTRGQLASILVRYGQGNR